MEQLYHTTELIGIKDKNIKILFILKHQTHLEIRAKLDYDSPGCPHCQGKCIKYHFQKSSKIPILDCQGFPTLLLLKKRRFQCKSCQKVTVAETALVKKNCQISLPIWEKVTQLHTENMTNIAIARRLHISVSIVQRKLAQFQFEHDFTKLPKVLSWDEFSRNKGKLAFIAQNFETRSIVTILDNNRQSTIKNYFYKYPRAVRETVEVVTVDMSGSYIPIIKQLFPRAKIVLDRFHIIQHLSRAMMTTRIDIMKTFDTRSLPYRSMKNHWRILQKDSRKLSLNRFFSRTFGQTVTPREVVQKTLKFSEELKFYYELYQILLFHFQEMNSKYFFELLEDNLDLVNPAFKTVFKTFLKYKTYITNAMELPYSNAKLEATNKLIKDIKRQAFGFRNFTNFKTKIYIAFNIKNERTNFVLSRC
ncbi:ISL3 family transposase [Streptococcus suis]|uniref:ISL3 family transposase n=3 Tax=Streptococcus suis TaxID=1307 RepID=UPI0020C3DE8C|nr:ISL3 family transposase [Streptococcus suis]MCP8379574.1 ISL3 family transposase [Streptococcus suis]